MIILDFPFSTPPFKDGHFQIILSLQCFELLICVRLRDGIVQSQLNQIVFQMAIEYILMDDNSMKLEAVICLCGNDGTGKSTLTKIITQLYPQFHAIQRSSKQAIASFEKLRMEIKHIDLLTYRYSFQKDREDFEPSSSVEIQSGSTLPVYWILLDLQPQIISRRIAKREQMGIYQSKKCIQYYSFVYLQLGCYYGMTIVDVNATVAQIVDKIAHFILTQAATQIRSLNLKHLTLETIQSYNAENQIIKLLSQEQTQQFIKLILQEIHESEAFNYLYQPEISKIIQEQNAKKSDFGKRLASRWLIKNKKIERNEKGELFVNCGSTCQHFTLQSPCFVNSIEGESKIILQLKSKNQLVQQYYHQKIWILLKSTIYSHTNQHTGEIENLSKIRATGSNLFLEMLRRNNIHHAYYAINKAGIILSKKVQTNNVQIIFKKEFVGTDKHSYFRLNEEKNIVGQQNQYKKGIYVRFDWRNPNHIIANSNSQLINSHKMYYIIEKLLGKQTFFKRFLQKSGIKPMGDKCIPQDLIFNYLDTKKVKQAILSLYCAFAYYCGKVGLEIIDGCSMLNNDGSMIWSEINPDCMRVKLNQDNIRTDMDKDIWRAGGSSSKQKITEKWNLFNEMLIQYFKQHRFHETELLALPPLAYTMNYEARNILSDQKLSLQPEYRCIFQKIANSTQQRKQIIGTIDISLGKPTLVKSSIFSQNHSQNNLQTAYHHVKLLPKLVLVDLDAAMNKGATNRQDIDGLCKKGWNNVYGVGGGIRDKATLQYYLNDLRVPKVIISTNLQLLNEIPRETIQQRIIIELSINQHNQVLTKGRTHNTHQNVTKKIIDLSRLGVKIISMTFHHKEGHLTGIPKQQFRDIMFQMPGTIQKVIIAGGISSFDDLQYIWGFPKAVPQLGSAIWKQKLKVQDLMASLLKFNGQGLIPAIITQSNGALLGEIFMDKSALKLTIETRQLYRFSRKLKRLIKKGQQSGNVQFVQQIKIDCDNDCLNIILQDNKNHFCHFNVPSCFDISPQKKTMSIDDLQRHILMKKQSGSGYSKQMQENECLAVSKFMEECFEFSISKNNIVNEGADVIAHMLMYLNSKNIPFSSISQELQRRANIVKVKKIAEVENQGIKKVVSLGVLGGKYYDKIDQALLNILGIHIIRAQNKSLLLDYHIQDQHKFNKYFKNIELRLLAVKSKDMGLMLSNKVVNYCFNYSIMMDNFPKIWKQLEKQLIPGLKLVLLKKKGRQINPLLWSSANKGKIIAEYPMSVVNYLSARGINERNYSILKVSGGSQGYLQSEIFDYVDAIVETGETISDNNLQIVQVLIDSNYGCLYNLL